MSLFSPFSIRDVTLPNRIVVSPMSQYRAHDGYANDWHFAHLSRFAMGGAGLVFTEATAVSRIGRRTHGDLGLWEDAQIKPLTGINQFIQKSGARSGIQLGHAGRKASERRPWHGETPVDAEDVQLRNETPWSVLGASPQPYAENWHVPKAMTQKDILQLLADFKAASQRADAAGFDVIEVYAAHGFLLHQFYSPLSNLRDDSYGGSFENRIRLTLEVADAIRTVWPAKKALFFRLSACDWVESGWQLDDTLELARRLQERGVDLIDCSSGGIGGPDKPQRMPLGPAFQAVFSEQVKKQTDLHSMAVGLIYDAKSANTLIETGKADLVALARELLANPNWPLQAASELEFDTEFSLWPPEFGWWLNKRQRLMQKLGLK